MSRLSFRTGLLGVLVAFGCAASPQHKSKPRPGPRVDAQAMQEAMRSSRESGEHYASSASYAHFLKARLLHHEGEHRRSLDELRLALVTDDGSPYLLVTMAEEYARVGDLGRAERSLRRVLETNPHHAKAHLLMGRVLSEGRKFARARVHLKRAIRLSPEEPDAYFTLAQVELEAMRPDGAVAAIEGLAKVLPDDSRGFRLLGMVFSERGDSRRAERMFQRAVEVFPGDYEAWAQLATLYESAERLEEAERAYAQALQRDPDNVPLLTAAGRTALRMEDVARARAWFDRALSLTQDPQTVVRIAFAWLSHERVGEALNVLDRARARPGSEPRLSFYAGLLHEKQRDCRRAAEAYGLVPEDADLYFESRMRQGASLSLCGEHARASALFQKMSKLQPHNPAVYPPWARALERSGSLEEAERLLRGTLAKWRVGELFVGLGQNLQRQGRAKEAVALLEQAVVELPQERALLFGLASACERAGLVDRAVEVMRAQVRAHPDDAAALNFLGYVLADHGRDVEEAERLVRRALELEPQSGAFWDSLGWIHFRKGEVGRAVEMLERASRMEPAEPVILEHLGDAYLKADRIQDAARAYRQALEALGHGEEPVDARAQRAGLEKKLQRIPSGSAGR